MESKPYSSKSDIDIECELIRSCSSFFRSEECRNVDMYRMKKEGFSASDISKKHNISSARVAEINNMNERKIGIVLRLEDDYLERRIKLKYEERAREMFLEINKRNKLAKELKNESKVHSSRIY